MLDGTRFILTMLDKQHRSCWKRSASGKMKRKTKAAVVLLSLLATAQERLYDRQERRLHAHECVNADELSARVMAVQRRAATPKYENGVHAAVTALYSL